MYWLIPTVVVDHVVEHRSTSSNRRQIQRDSVVISNELFQLSTSIAWQQHAKAPQKCENIQTLISVVLGCHLAVVSVRQQTVKQSTRLTDCVQFRVLGLRWQVLLDKTEKTGKRSIKQTLETPLFVVWTTLQPPLSSLHNHIIHMYIWTIRWMWK